MSRLPEAVGRVTIPLYWSPSTLEDVRTCRLRALAGSVEWADRLPPGPAAQRGRAFHELLERAAKGRIPRRGSAAEDVSRELDALLEQLGTTLLAEPDSAHYAKLEDTVGKLQWLSLRKRIERQAAELLNRSPIARRAAVPGMRPPHRVRIQEVREGESAAEVLIEAPTLRLRGRVDLVERPSHSRFVVRDYKTGRVHAADGAVREGVQLQLRLYALMVRELDPRAEVDLLVDTGVEYRVPVNESSLRDLRAWWLAVLSSLPQGEVSAVTLASPGPGCWHCPVRHVCPAYRTEAPNLWRTRRTDDPMPLDIWGQPSAIERRDEGYDVRLVDAAGRHAKIFRLSPRHAVLGEGSSSGRALWFFGLEASGHHKTLDGDWVHPRNFHELPADASERRAWNLKVFWT